jgi:pilus assembly protein CpaE
MDQVARVVLAMEQHDVAEEVMHFLDRSGHARVVGMAGDDRQLLDAIRQLEPDAVIAQPSLVRAGLNPTLAGTLLALDTRETIGSLRTAIQVGASGFFIWPADREALSSATAASVAPPVLLERRATVVVVHSSRGGAGTTFVATHLARAFARRGLACVLVDGDPVSGELGAAIGAPTEGVHSVSDLLPLAAELTANHLDETLWTHPDGFRVLLAPPPSEAANVDAVRFRLILEGVATISDVAVVSLPTSLDGPTGEAIHLADRIVEVLTLDVLSFRATTRVLEAHPDLDIADRLVFVVNRAARSEITPRDVERVFDRSALAVIPHDRAVPRSQDHGRLLPVRGRTGRIFRRLASKLIEDPPEGSPAPHGSDPPAVA